jgi:PAS domain S-box-containing protein
VKKKVEKMIIPEKINVLYIEDDEQNAELIYSFLSTSKITKFNVIHKNTLEKGLNYLKKECRIEELMHKCETDVILLDLVLPDSTSGLDTFKLVLAQCNCIPIVVVSGYEEIACQCVKLGAQDYLYKPEFNAGTLVRSLKYAIERRKLMSNLEESEKRFKLLSEASFEGVVISKGGVIVDINKQFADIIQCSQEDLIGQKVWKYVAQKDIDLVKDNVKANYEEVYEHTAIKKDGTEFPVEIHGKTLPNGLRLTAVRDMSRYKEAEENLRKKEEIIFNELEIKIHQWKSEITGREYEKLEMIDNQISSLSNEVHGVD